MGGRFRRTAAWLHGGGGEERRLPWRRRAELAAAPEPDPLGVRAAAHCGEHAWYVSGCDDCLGVLAVVLADLMGLTPVTLPSVPEPRRAR